MNERNKCHQKHFQREEESDIIYLLCTLEMYLFLKDEEKMNANK